MVQITLKSKPGSGSSAAIAHSVARGQGGGEQNGHENAATGASDLCRGGDVDSSAGGHVAGLDAGSRSADSSLRLSGPKTNKIGTDFDYTISGYASGAANYVVAWEQFNEQSGCATTYAAESTRVFLQSTYELTLWLNRSVSSNYSLLARFGADHSGKHGICAYLINLSSGDTYAYGGAFWTNVQ